MRTIEVNVTKQEARKQDLGVLKLDVEKEAWAALKAYFNGNGNGSEAKIAVVTLGVLAKEMQAKNNARQMDIIEKRMSLMLPLPKE